MLQEQPNPENLDDFLLPIGHPGIRFQKLKDIPLDKLDRLLGWLEDKKTRPDLQEILVKYLRDNHYDA
jgi:hypothetical protein